MWPGSAACHRPALSLLCFSFYQQLLHRHSAAVANESSDLLPAFSHPLSQPGSPFWLSLSSLSLSSPPPLFASLHGIFFHILSHLPLPPCLCVCSSPASFCYTTSETLQTFPPALFHPLFFFYFPPVVPGVKRQGQRHMLQQPLSWQDGDGGDISSAIWNSRQSAAAPRWTAIHLSQEHMCTSLFKCMGVCVFLCQMGSNLTVNYSVRHNVGFICK